MTTGTWTPRANRTMRGIRGATDVESIVPRMATIGRLHKGAERTDEDKAKRRPGVDLNYFRFASERPEIMAAFEKRYGEKPQAINGFLPFPTADECFQTCMEEWVAGGLVHRCDGQEMTIWRDTSGAYHQEPKPCPYFGHPELRTRRDEKKGIPENPGCRWVGRLYIIIPELLEAGHLGLVSLVETSKHDILRIRAALLDYEERRRLEGATIRPLFYFPITLRRIPEMVSQPRENGQRVRGQKWLVVIEPMVEWVRRELAAAREGLLPELLESGPAQRPDWEDASTAGPNGNGREVVDAEVVDVEQPAEPPGFAEADDEPPPETYDEASPSHGADAWLADLKAAMQEATVDSRPASTKQKTLAALLLQRCWAELEPGTALDERRREFTRLAMGHKLSEASVSEASLLIRALGGDELDAAAMGYVRALVARGLPGQAELFQEEAVNG